MVKSQPDIQNDKMIKNYILIGLISILIVFGIVVSIKCKNLEKENLQLKCDYTTVVDSIKMEKQILETRIGFLSEELIVCEHKIDSLKKLKQRVIVEYKTKYIVSENLTEGVKTLKENLRCEKY